MLGAALAAIGFLPSIGQAETTSTQTAFLTQAGHWTRLPAIPRTSRTATACACHTASTARHCAVARRAPLPDPSKPPSFPDNFPEESFYFLSQASITLPSGGRATYDGSVEAAVTLDGSGSINGDSYAWTQTSGPSVTLTDADQKVATFTAPAQEATLGFQLTVSGPAGSSTDDVLVTVQAVTTPVADAGADQTGVLADNTVLLDASNSTGAASFAWTQVSGTSVTLTNADTSRASFTMPATSSPLVFRVTITGPAGTASDEVTITAQLDTLTISRAEYRSDQQQWRIDGTATILDDNVVSVYVGSSASGALIGSAQVDPLDGSFDVRVRGSAVPPSGSTVFVQSTRGGQALAVFTQQ